MTYQEARTFIDNASRYGSKLGLETVTELLDRLGNPQDKLRIIHVAGTNGKGSTAAFLANILACCGYRVGRYISPAVFSYRERIQITGAEQGRVITDYITKKGVIASIAKIKPVCEKMVQDGINHPTSFEIETAMAFLYLEMEKVDLAVIEVGLGGRLDATNVIKQPVCCVITSISRDHMQYLGDSLELIAAEKAGVIKKGIPVVTGNSNPEVIGVLKRTCEKENAILTFVDREEAINITAAPEGTEFTYRGKEYRIRLLGDYQISNAILAIETAALLDRSGYRLENKAVQEGLRNTVWSGRFEVLARDPYFIIDGAHNEDAALELKKTIEQYFTGRTLIFILGVLADKDYIRVLEITAGLAKTILTITPPNDRALPSTQLARVAKDYCQGVVIDAGKADRAVKYAYQVADKEDVIIAFGSLSFLREIRSVLLGG